MKEELRQKDEEIVKLKDENERLLGIITRGM